MDADLCHAKSEILLFRKFDWKTSFMYASYYYIGLEETLLLMYAEVHGQKI